MNYHLLQVTYTLNNIDEAVRQFWDQAQGYNILAFSGAMGAGKTTFIHKLCDYLQVQDVVSSPTFALINEYHFTDTAGQDKTIYHLDWYRLKDTEEAINAGMEDCIEQARRGDAYCFIEWPEKAKELLSGTYLWVSIEVVDRETREMEVMVNG